MDCKPSGWWNILQIQNSKKKQFGILYFTVAYHLRRGVWLQWRWREDVASLAGRRQNSLLLTSPLPRRTAKPTLTDLDGRVPRICLGGGELRKRTVHHPNGAVLIVVQELPSATVTKLLRNVLLKLISRNLQEVDDTFTALCVRVCVCVPREIQAPTYRQRNSEHLHRSKEGNNFLFIFTHQSTPPASWAPVRLLGRRYFFCFFFLSPCHTE